MNDLTNEMIEEGYITTRSNGDLTLLNYSRTATYERKWNAATQQARGFIYNHVTGEIVAWPLEKFFNLGEGDFYPNTPIVSVTVKMDGSCGILYRQDGQHKIATRGSFESDQATWATEKLNSGLYDLDAIPDNLTLVFEVIYPNNRIVIDYADEENLVLLFARNRHSGEEMSYEYLSVLAACAGFDVVDVIEGDSLEPFIEKAMTLPANEEGWVILFEDGTRFKIKGLEYVALHKVISDFTPKKIRQAWIEGLTEDMRKTLPEEFWDDFDETVSILERMLIEFSNRLEIAFAQAPKGTRREFAIWTNENAKNMSGFMFSKLDGYINDIKFRDAGTAKYVEEMSRVQHTTCLSPELLATIAAS